MCGGESFEHALRPRLQLPLRREHVLDKFSLRQALVSGMVNWDDSIIANVVSRIDYILIGSAYLVSDRERSLDLVTHYTKHL